MQKCPHRWALGDFPRGGTCPREIGSRACSVRCRLARSRPLCARQALTRRRDAASGRPVGDGQYRVPVQPADVDGTLRVSLRPRAFAARGSQRREGGCGRAAPRECVVQQECAAQPSASLGRGAEPGKRGPPCGSFTRRRPGAWSSARRRPSHTPPGRGRTTGARMHVAG